MEVKELPEGWVEVKINNICKPKQYQTISLKQLTQVGYIVYGANGIIGKYSTYTHKNPTIMITCRGANCGNVHISKPYSYINGNAMALDGINFDEFNLRYLYYYLQFDGLSSVVSGSAQPQITKSNLSKLTIAICAKLEQQQIAKLLDNHLTQVEQIQNSLNAIPKILEKFRQSVLADAVSGKLTEDWRESSSNNSYPSSWTITSLSEVGNLSRGKSKHRPRNDKKLFGEEYPFIQTGEVANSDGIINSATKFYSEFGLSQSKLFPKGTLCITIAANIADTAILGIDACFPDSIVGFIPNDEQCETKFIKYFIDVHKNHLEHFAPATAQKNINLKILNAIEINLPPLPEQTEIVRRVEELFAFADQIEERVAQAQSRVNHLTQSILNQAFTGKLTEQWRADNIDLITGDNSAAALLASIESKRQSSKAKKSSKRGSKAKKDKSP